MFPLFVIIPVDCNDIAYDVGRSNTLASAFSTNICAWTSCRSYKMTGAEPTCSKSSVALRQQLDSPRKGKRTMLPARVSPVKGWRRLVVPEVVSRNSLSTWSIQLAPGEAQFRGSVKRGVGFCCPQCLLAEPHRYVGESPASGRCSSPSYIPSVVRGIHPRPG